MFSLNDFIKCVISFLFPNHLKQRKKTVVKKKVFVNSNTFFSIIFISSSTLFFLYSFPRARGKRIDEVDVNMIIRLIEDLLCTCARASLMNGKCKLNGLDEFILIEYINGRKKKRIREKSRAFEKLSFELMRRQHINQCWKVGVFNDDGLISRYFNQIFLFFSLHPLCPFYLNK